jgi:hypothetical protein
MQKPPMEKGKNESFFINFLGEMKNINRVFIISKREIEKMS